MSETLIKHGTTSATSREVQVRGTLQVHLFDISQDIGGLRKQAQLAFELIGPTGDIICKYESKWIDAGEAMRIDMPVEETIIIQEYDNV